MDFLPAFSRRKMVRQYLAFTSISICLLYSSFGHCQDKFYRYSTPSGNYQGIYTAFPEEEKINRQHNNYITTYTGTSIPPGINDGYNSTPGGYYNRMGEEVTKEGNQIQ